VTALFVFFGYAAGLRVSAYLPNPMGASLPVAISFLAIALAFASTARNLLAERRLVLPLAAGAAVCLAASGHDRDPEQSRVAQSQRLGGAHV